MKALVGGGLADRVVDRQLAHPGGVEQPADHQHRLARVRAKVVVEVA